MAEDGFANFVDVAAGGEVHHGVGAVVDGGVELFEFLVDFGGDGGVADVGVDLAERGDADRHRLEFRMVDIGGDDHASTGDFVADQLGRQLFFVGDEGHLFRDHALAGVVHLGEIAVGVFFLAAGQPLCARLGDAVTVAAIAIGSHGNPRVRNSVRFDYNRVWVRWSGRGRLSPQRTRRTQRDVEATQQLEGNGSVCGEPSTRQRARSESNRATRR